MHRRHHSPIKRKQKTGQWSHQPCRTAIGRCWAFYRQSYTSCGFERYQVNSKRGQQQTWSFHGQVLRRRCQYLGRHGTDVVWRNLVCRQLQLFRMTVYRRLPDMIRYTSLVTRVSDLILETLVQNNMIPINNSNCENLWHFNLKYYEQWIIVAVTRKTVIVRY